MGSDSTPCERACVRRRGCACVVTVWFFLAAWLRGSEDQVGLLLLTPTSDPDP